MVEDEQTARNSFEVEQHGEKEKHNIFSKHLAQLSAELKHSAAATSDLIPEL